jgi:hypothetical protein
MTINFLTITQNFWTEKIETRLAATGMHHQHNNNEQPANFLKWQVLQFAAWKSTIFYKTFHSTFFSQFD